MAAGHSGGSWKVAYADFVTAMMAFFLVMWIGAQDQKTRQSVANYFVDPSGSAKKPVRTGAVLDSMTYGNLPNSDSVAMGRGRQSFSEPGETSPATKRVNDWIHSTPESLRRWREQAQECREAAAMAAIVKKKETTVEAVAARELSIRLRAAIAAEGPKTAGVQQDLFYWSLDEVNWTQIAEELLTT
jgi:chemotaxis protein MotB